VQRSAGISGALLLASAVLAASAAALAIPLRNR